MREREIRELVLQHVRDDCDGHEDLVVIEELGVLYGAGRVDVAAVNGRLCGYEIKSEQDSLRRLPRQVELFEQVMDDMTLVVDQRHFERALPMTPESWGIAVAHDAGEGLEQVRRPSADIDVDASAVLQLLWKEELVELAVDRSVSRPARMRKADLIDCLAQTLGLDEIRRTVRETLKTRTNWRDRV